MAGGDDDHPTETSALIFREDEAIQPVEPGAGIAPEAPADHSTSNHGTIAPNGSPNGDAETLERQISAQDRQKQHEGLPEVKKQLKYILPALSIGIYLSAADQTIIVSSYGKIGTDLNALNMTSWIATAYFLTLTSFQPLYGKLSDIFGRKACLLNAYAIFGIGCLFCGLAKDINQLIIARAIAGIGGGGMSTVVSIMLSDIVTLRERGTYQGYLNIIFAAGASSGAPLGGLLSDSVGWRWAFLGQVPLCVVAFIAVSFVLKLPQKDSSNWRQKLRRIDFLGAAVLISAVFMLLVALDRGSNVSWKATITIVSLAVAIPLCILFVLVETRFAKEPFAPGHVIFNRTMIACFLVNFFGLAAFMGVIFYVPLHWQAVDSLSATGAGLRLIPNTICGVSGSLFAGIYMKRTGKFYWLTVLANFIMVPGILIITLTSGPLIESVPLMIVGMCVTSFFNGLSITSTLIGLIANASHDDQAIATACSYLFRSLGSVTGVSLSATVANLALRNSLASELPKLGLGEDKALQIADRVRQSLEYLRQLEPEVRKIVVKSYTSSTTAAFGLEAGLAVGAAVSAWFIREKALGK